MNTATAAGKKPRIGTDCSTSSVGRMMRARPAGARGQPAHGQGEGDGEEVGDGEPGQGAHEVQGQQDGPGVQLGRVERTQVRAAENDDDDEGGDEDEKPHVDGERRRGDDAAKERGRPWSPAGHHSRARARGVSRSGARARVADVLRGPVRGGRG